MNRTELPEYKKMAIGIMRRNSYRKAQQCVNDKNKLLSQEKINELKKLSWLIWDVTTEEEAEKILSQIKDHLKTIQL